MEAATTTKFYNPLAVAGRVCSGQFLSLARATRVDEAFISPGEFVQVRGRMKLYGTEIRLLSPKCLNFFRASRRFNGRERGERERSRKCRRRRRRSALFAFVSEAKEMAAHSDLTRALVRFPDGFSDTFPTTPSKSLGKFRDCVVNKSDLFKQKKKHFHLSFLRGQRLLVSSPTHQ